MCRFAGHGPLFVVASLAATAGVDAVVEQEKRKEKKEKTGEGEGSDDVAARGGGGPGRLVSGQRQ